MDLNLGSKVRVPCAENRLDFSELCRGAQRLAGRLVAAPHADGTEKAYWMACRMATDAIYFAIWQLNLTPSRVRPPAWDGTTAFKPFRFRSTSGFRRRCAKSSSAERGRASS